MTDNSDDGNLRGPLPAVETGRAPEADPLPELTAPAIAAPDPVAPAVAGPKPPGRFRRFFDWFWRGRAIAALGTGNAVDSTAVLVQLGHARYALELGDRVLERREPPPGVGPDATACELYRQSIYWVFVARAARAGGPSAPSPAPAATLAELWELADEQRLASALGGAEALTDLRTALGNRDFRDFAAFSPEEQARLARLLQQHARALLESMEVPRAALDALLMQRVSRIGLTFALLLGLVAGVIASRQQLERWQDVADGKPWTISSRFAIAMCQSPAQECEESPLFFFHTLEEANAWVEIDLLAHRQISAVRLVNRRDCCQERATPLVVEVSADRKKWSDVAKRTRTFDSWRADFPPVTARWVRVRALHRTPFHLARVRVF